MALQTPQNSLLTFPKEFAGIYLPLLPIVSQDIKTGYPSLIGG
jgi:hypothetical protein